LSNKDMRQAKTEMVTIPKIEYIKLKQKAKAVKVDKKLVLSIIRSLEDVKHGRVTEWKG